MAHAGISSDYSAHVTPSKNPKFGDYQANGAMAAAKAMKTNPRELATKIVDSLTLDGIAEKIEIAGPGFINIHLDQAWLAEQASTASADERLGVPLKAHAQTVVVDYSAPNLAKEMHVGHLRSTIIGDAITRVLAFLGDNVIRQNHVGDWGTQFGMLIAELEDQLEEGEAAELALKDLEGFYQQSKKHFDSEPEFANRARDYVVKLQSGEAHIRSLWEKFKNISLTHNQEIYEKLNVTLTHEHVRGESHYNDDLSVLVNELKAQKLAVEDQGAQVVFLEELADKNGDPSVAIIQKNDGGYLYATTDLAAMRYRSNTLKAERLLYFIDDRQSLHMKQVFAIARKAKFVDENISLEHHAFGKMLGADGKPFKTRTGGTVKLAALLQEAVERAEQLVLEKQKELAPEDQLSKSDIALIAESVGIGAVKYADLAKTRTNDYVFDWEAMLKFEGNTGPYMQYAYTRIQSIFRKAGVVAEQHSAEIRLQEKQERALVLKALQFAEVVQQVGEEAYPHTLCTYLYDLASSFMSFYEACPILKEGVEPDLRDSRLQISKVVAMTLKMGLDLLGIRVMEKM